MASLKSRLAELFGRTSGLFTFAESRLIIDHPDKDVRLSLAKRTDVDPEVLLFLAGDPEPDVRMAVANNGAAPGKSWLMLADDESAEIREAIARRLPAILPGHGTSDQDRITRSVTTVLRLLVRDELPKIRMVLCEALREMPEAPHEIVKSLAHDPVESIALPMIELSPVLTDEDLIEIIASSPLTSKLAGISKRKRVSDTVSAAIVHTGDAAAIESLLRNSSAQIREETLDLIADMAPAHTRWHGPLACRPNISEKIAAKISEFVSASLIAQLCDKTDLAPSTLVYLKRMLSMHAEKRGNGHGPLDAVTAATSEMPLRAALFRAETMRLGGHLTNTTLVNTIAKGLSPLAVAMLAVQAEVPLAGVVKAVRSSSARALVALAWAADLTAEQAIMVQRELGRISPDNVIRPTSAGFYGVPEFEMQSQIDALSSFKATSAA